MKAVLAIAVISCLLVVAYAQSLSCITRVGELASCLGRLPNARSDSTFCSDCANSLVSYYQECTNRNDIDSLLEGGLYVYIKLKLSFNNISM